MQRILRLIISFFTIGGLLSGSDPTSGTLKLGPKFSLINHAESEADDDDYDSYTIDDYSEYDPISNESESDRLLDFDYYKNTGSNGLSDGNNQSNEFATRNFILGKLCSTNG